MERRRGKGVLGREYSMNEDTGSRMSWVVGRIGGKRVWIECKIYVREVRDRLGVGRLIEGFEC